MIDKSKRMAKVEQHGNVVVVRMKGGPDCLWLNMYLDTVDWQMTCDSDIGFYAYHWGPHTGGKDETFVEFCCRWLYDEEWLLRKCIGERHVEKRFDLKKTVENLRTMIHEDTDGEDEDNLEYALETAEGYSDDCRGWAAAFSVAADHEMTDLPDEWYECIEEDYSPWQKRFAEICAEVIVPLLRKIR